MAVIDDLRTVLGVEPSCTEFDNEILIHANSALMTLGQIADANIPEITADTNWSDICNIELYQAVRTWLMLEVRIAFDPPATSFALSALKDKATELLWRLEAEWEWKGQ